MQDGKTVGVKKTDSEKLVEEACFRPVNDELFRGKVLKNGLHNHDTGREFPDQNLKGSDPFNYFN
jgi:hypothetical protein